jgi:hypothetical protein
MAGRGLRHLVLLGILIQAGLGQAGQVGREQVPDDPLQPSIVGRNMSALARRASTRLEQGKPPIANYTASLPADPRQRAIREARNTRYDHRETSPIREMPLGVEELPINSHWWVCIPAIPSVKSDLIVTGTVVAAEAYLSNDKTGLYSEFTVHVDRVLKSSSLQDIAARSDISVERAGGAIRFPSGRVQERQRLQGSGNAGRGRPIRTFSEVRRQRTLVFHSHRL